MNVGINPKIKLTGSCPQDGNITVHLIGKSLYIEDIFDTWHEVPNQKSDWIGSILVLSYILSMIL